MKSVYRPVLVTGPLIGNFDVSDPAQRSVLKSPNLKHVLKICVDNVGNVELNLLIGVILDFYFFIKALAVHKLIPSHQKRLA
jgi:hypothetical protein